MKNFFIILLFCLSSVTLFAQRTDKLNQFEVSVAVSGSTGDKSVVGINSLFIYDRIIGDFGVGAGTGFLFSNTDSMGGDDFYRSIPFVVDMRWMPKLSNSVSFVGVFNAGALVHLGDTDKSMGHYVSPQAGFRFRIANGWAVNLRALYSNFNTVESVNTFGAVLGISF